MADLNQVRRRADEFARLVDGTMPSPNPVQDPEFARAMQLVEAMRDAGAVEPRPDFSASLRQRLIDEAEARIIATPHFPPDLPDDTDDDADLVEPTPLHGPRHRRGRLVAGAAAFLVLAGGIGSAAAAQQSMPGDTLYALKRGLESVASKVSVTDDSRGRRELSHALARLTEAERLVDNKAPNGTVNDTLQDFSSATRSGGDHLLASFRSDNDASAIEKIYVFAEEARARLVDLQKQSPAPVRPAVADAMRSVGAIVQQALKACPTCVAPKTMTTMSPDSVPTQTLDPNDPSISNPLPSQPGSTDLATPGIPAQPPTLQTPKLPTVPSTSDSGALPTKLPTLPTKLPTLPSIPIPTGGPISIPLPTLPGFTLPTLQLPPLSLPPLLPKLRLAPATPVPGSATKPSVAPTSATSSSAKPAAKETSEPTKAAPQELRPAWPWFSGQPSAPLRARPPVSLPSPIPTTLPSILPAPASSPISATPTSTTPTASPTQTPR